MKYGKIQTVWKRDEENNGSILMGNYSKEEFAQVRSWVLTEKIDGQCITVIITKDNIKIQGKSEKTQFNKAHKPLLAYLNETITRESIDAIFDWDKADTITLYGEGYGPKIQSGGKYRKDQSFIMFDILIDTVWLETEKVATYAYLLGIDSVPVWGNGTVPNIMHLIQTKPKSAIEGANCVVEGFVCRSEPLMLDRFGNRIMWKIKVRDFEQLERRMQRMMNNEQI